MNAGELCKVIKDKLHAQHSPSARDMYRFTTVCIENDEKQYIPVHKVKWTESRMGADGVIPMMLVLVPDEKVG